MADDQGEAPVITVLIADGIAHIVEHLERLGEFTQVVQVCGIARHRREAIDEARARQPDVVLVGATLMEGGSDDLVQELTAASPRTRIVLQGSSNADNGAARANGVQTVPADASPAELVSAIRGAQAQSAANVPGPTAMAATTEPMHEVVPRRPRSPGQARGEIYAVHSGKGGVGKSVLASNLAVALAVETDSRVALVDLDLQHGDAGVMMHIDAHRESIEDLVTDGVTQELLHRVMATGPSGVRVLLAPASPERAATITRSIVRDVLQELRMTYDHIVVDTPAHLDDVIIDTIQVADVVLLVTTFNVTTVKSTRATLRLLRALRVEPRRIVLVLNQMRPRMAVPCAEIEAILRFRMLTQLPYEPWVDDAVDSGRPLVLGHPRSPLSRQLSAIVHYLVPGSRPDAPAAAHRRARQHSPAPLRRFTLSRRWLRMGT